MEIGARGFASSLRREISARNRACAQGQTHVESFGSDPVVVYAPECSTGGSERHGNFFDRSYAAIVARPEWMRRFDKMHAQARALPRAESGRRWRELDSSMSSDALLMNVFCAPEAHAMRQTLAVDEDGLPEFGWKARVPLASGRFDRTEVDMRWGSLLVEAKLTEGDFQTRAAAIVEGYRDFDAVFDREMLPRVLLRTARRRTAIEFAEEFTQEWEAPADDEGAGARAFQAEMVARAEAEAGGEAGYAGYQLIRNVLAAHAVGARFCMIHDARRPDLREAWFQVMASVRSAELRTRCMVFTWQELAAMASEDLQAFLDVKYGIVAPGTISSAPEETVESE